VIGRAAFAKLLRDEPQIAAALLRTLATRLRGCSDSRSTEAIPARP